MQTGTITNLMPTVDGGYQSQNGWIYTFDISIQTQQGLVTGEIGAKSQAYPLNVNDQINFEVTNTNQGVKIKKVNPQYAQGAPPINQPQGQAPPQRGRAESPARDYDKENRGKCRFGFYSTLLGDMSAVDLLGNLQELQAVEKLVELAMNGFPPQGAAADGMLIDEDIPF